MGFEIYLIPFPFAENQPPYHRLVISNLDTINMQILPVKPSFSMSAQDLRRRVLGNGIATVRIIGRNHSLVRNALRGYGRYKMITRISFTQHDCAQA
jgi:hypothetical protein